MEAKEVIQARKLMAKLAFVMIHGTRTYNRDAREQIAKEANEWLDKNKIPIISENQP